MSEPETHDLLSAPLEVVPTNVAMEATQARGWKLYVGLALFVYSWGTLGIAALSAASTNGAERSDPEGKELSGFSGQLLRYVQA